MRNHLNKVIPAKARDAKKSERSFSNAQHHPNPPPTPRLIVKTKAKCCEKFMRKAKACKKCPLFVELSKKKRRKKIDRLRRLTKAA